MCAKFVNMSDGRNSIIGAKENLDTLFSRETVNKLKTFSGPVGLLIALMVYTLVGGLIFRQLELPADIQRLTRTHGNLISQRSQLISRILNNTDIQIHNLAKIVKFELELYENALQEAFHNGFPINLLNKIKSEIYDSDLEVVTPYFTDRWSILQAVFFASTVLTTIGYGNVVPTTNLGRTFCIFFALIGIPLTLTVIADWGKLFAEIVSKLASKLSNRFPTLFVFWLPQNTTGRRSLGAFAAVTLLFIYLSCGAVMFMIWEDDWNFFDGFYFCFVTMTTIGFGDLVPKKPNYMLFCSLYILVGLAITGTIIELVRKQYVQSWHRLQSLRGPLTETLRRIGEQAGGDMSALQSDLRRAVTLISMPKLRNKRVIGDINDTDIQEAIEAILRDIVNASRENLNKPVCQIIYYESNV